MKILIISYTYLPEISPRTLRWSQIIKTWQDEGHIVQVITASGNLSHYDKDGNTISIIEENFFGRIRKKLQDKSFDKTDKEKKLSQGLSLAKIWKVPLRFILSRLYKLFMKSLQWPDYSWTWIFSAKRELKSYLEQDNSFDIMISVSHPFSSHIIANFIKKNNPHLRWIIDMGDPFCFLTDAQPNNFKIYSKLNKKVERTILNNSCAACVTTNETKEEYLKLFPELEKKITVIPPVVNEEFINYAESLKTSVKEHDQVIRLVFTGTLYSKIRNPTFLLNTLQKVSLISDKVIEINFYGSVNDFDINLLPSFDYKVTFHGEVPKQEIFKVMMQSDILVNIGNSTHYQLPSKLVDYAATGKSILNISSIKKDSSSVFLEKYTNSINICSEDKLSKEYLILLRDFIEARETMRLDDVKYFLSDYRLKNISESYERLLK